VVSHVLGFIFFVILSTVIRHYVRAALNRRKGWG
jgi:hypothetical protein